MVRTARSPSSDASMVSSPTPGTSRWSTLRPPRPGTRNIPKLPNGLEEEEGGEEEGCCWLEEEERGWEDWSSAAWLMYCSMRFSSLRPGPGKSKKVHITHVQPRATHYIIYSRVLFAFFCLFCVYLLTSLENSNSSSETFSVLLMSTSTPELSSYKFTIQKLCILWNCL